MKNSLVGTEITIGRRVRKLWSNFNDVKSREIQRELSFSLATDLTEIVFIFTTVQNDRNAIKNRPKQYSVSSVIRRSRSVTFNRFVAAAIRQEAYVIIVRLESNYEFDIHVAKIARQSRKISLSDSYSVKIARSQLPQVSLT